MNVADGFDRRAGALGDLECRHVLVCLPTWVGDAVMATPTLRALRSRFPDSRITLFGRGHLESLLEGESLYDQYVPIERGRGATAKNIATIRGLDADLAVVLPHSFRAAYEVYRAGVPRRLGYAREGRGWMLTHSVTPHLRPRRRSIGAWLRGVRIGVSDKISKRWLTQAAQRQPSLLRERRDREPILPIPMVAQYLELIAVLGARDDGAGLTLGIPPHVAEGADRDLETLGFARDESFVAVNPGASFGETKVYPLDLLADALDRLHGELGWKTLVLCGPGEETLADELAAQMKTPVVSSSAQMLGLDRVKRAIERAELLVTTDTGPWHVANAVATPSVVLMGPTDPRYTAAYLERSVVLREEVECGPCHLKQCPLDHRCMRMIEPRRVAETAMALLGRS